MGQDRGIGAIEQRNDLYLCLGWKWHWGHFFGNAVRIGDGPSNDCPACDSDGVRLPTCCRQLSVFFSEALVFAADIHFRLIPLCLIDQIAVRKYQRGFHRS